MANRFPVKLDATHCLPSIKSVFMPAQLNLLLLVTTSYHQLLLVTITYYQLLLLTIGNYWLISNLVTLSAERKVRFHASSAEFVTRLAFLMHSLSLWTLQYYSKAGALFKLLWPLCLVSLLSRPLCKAINQGASRKMASQEHWQLRSRQEL